MVKCKFVIYDPHSYGCKIEYTTIPSEVTAETFVGEHIGNRTNDDVTSVVIIDSVCKKLPNGLGEVFKNLLVLNINPGWECHRFMFRELTKENLKQFPKLECLLLWHSEFKNLPKDLFEFNKNLKAIWLNQNHIQSIEFGLLDELQDLEELYMGGNKIEFIPGNLFKFNKKIKKINFCGNKIKFIGPEFLDGLEELEYVSLAANLCINDKYDKEEGDGLEKLEEIKAKIKSLKNPEENVDE